MKQVGEVAAAIVDRWAWWQNALKGEFGPIHHEPNQGYYRVRPKDGQWEPVAIWFDTDRHEWIAYRSGREVPADDIWTWACRNPITYEAYEKAMAGEGFSDEPEKAPDIGHNSGEADPFDTLRIEYLGEKEMAEAFMRKPVKTQDDADKVAIWAKRLTAIKTKAEGLHKVEKQPHLDAGRVIDDKWRELKTEPDELAKKLKQHVKPFFDEQRLAEEDRQRLAREEADRKRREVEDAARAARHADVLESDEVAAARQAEIDRLAREAAEAEREAQAQRITAGRTGARIGIRVEKIGVVTDYAKAAAALSAMKHKDFIELIDKLANRAAKNGMAFDGMEIQEIEKVV